ncbi:hypothetical protein [Chelativorans sp. AA-79]|uniref:hypothetical protein n=1 Tax=Chelativorans sp. AA-79 TaxID=3028735 RepID=UPI0023F7147E|nr:hypothetical protein [Chelativorans sp. AA-79]WEX11104.1 hypothetical protein PVE73_09300 [Chelativorans sp. AA-79]
MLTAVKDREQSSLLDFSWPTEFDVWDNLVEVITTRNWMVVTAFITIPPLLVLLFFNRQIIAGMTAGSVKG